MRYLSQREHSGSELRHKLLARDFPEAVVEEVVADLSRKGLQSDARFAEIYTRSRIEKGYGVLRIRQELRQRGIRETAEPDWDDADWDALIERVYVKKFGSRAPDTPAGFATRERFLRQRGFSGDQIRRLFKRMRQGAGGRDQS